MSTAVTGIIAGHEFRACSSLDAGSELIGIRPGLIQWMLRVSVGACGGATAPDTLEEDSNAVSHSSHSDRSGVRVNRQLRPRDQSYISFSHQQLSLFKTSLQMMHNGTASFNSPRVQLLPLFPDLSEQLPGRGVWRCARRQAHGGTAPLPLGTTERWAGELHLSFCQPVAVQDDGDTWAGCCNG